ncbi:MAG: hypothetical protein WAO71_02560 [Gallionella sp.]
MKKAIFEVYQYVAPAVLTPLSFFLWWRTYDGNIWLTLIAWLTPILYAYIVPGVGTNILKVWEFDTRFRLGRFRPHHGFVFGSATASLAWLCHGGFATSVFDLFQTSLVLASVLGFWNVLYDVKAIESGILRVYNQPWADDKGVEAITLDYAPWFFAGFGAIYGLGIAGAEWLAAQGLLNATVFCCLFPVLLLTAIAFPVWGYRRRSYRVHGHSGCHPIAKE